jgi:hypothetical protein
MIDSETNRESSLGVVRGNATRAVRRTGLHLTRLLVAVLTLQVGTYHPVALAAYPVQSIPADAEPSQAPERLRVTVDPQIEDASLISGWVMSRHPDLDDTLSGSLEEWIAVEITGATYDYRVLVVAMRGGDAVGAAEMRSCECTNEDLLELADEIEEARTRLRTIVTLEPTSRPAQDSTRIPEPMATPQVTADLRPADRFMRSIGYIGIGAGVLGVGMIAAGIPLALKPKQVRGGAGGIETLSTRRVGIGFTMLGSMTLALSAGLFAFDFIRIRRHRLVLIPDGGNQSLGLTLAGSF